MGALSKYFGGLKMGQIIPAYDPNDSRLLFCDGTQEVAVNANNEFLGQQYPRVTAAVARQYFASTTPAFAVNDVTFGNGTYVCVGTDISGSAIKYCMTSTDGRNWVMREMPVANMWKFVVWTGQFFLAYAWDGNASGVIARSDDGMTWVSANTTSATDYNAVWVVDGMAVALYNSTQYWVTLDGVNWNGYSPNVYPTKVRMFKGSLYGRYSSTLYKSDNGVNWVAVTNITGFLDFEVNGTTLVCISSSVNQTKYTTDGTTFNTVTVPAFRNNVVWNGENFVAFSSGTNDIYRTSPDGITWTQRTFGSAAYTSMSRLVAPNPATGDVFALSPNTNLPQIPVLTKTWGFAITTPVLSGVQILGVKHNGTRYISFGYHTSNQYPFIATSEDGLNWTHREVPAATAYGSVKDMAFLGNVCVGAGISGQMVYSNDGGLTWSLKAFANQAYKIACNGTLFVASLSPNSSSQYYTSTDGLTWTSRNASITFSGLTNNGTRFGMTSYPGSGNVTPYYSDDGINWTSGTQLATGGSYEIYGFKTYWMIPYINQPTIYRFALNMTGATSISLGQNFSGGGTQRVITTPTAAMLWCDNLGIYSTTTDGVTWTARSFLTINQNLSIGAANANTGEWLLMNGNSNGRVIRSQDLVNWSFYTSGYGVTTNVGGHTYAVKLGTRVISAGCYRNDGEYFWKPLFIPAHAGGTASNNVLATNGVGVVSAYATTNGSDNMVSIAYSTDGIEWTLSPYIGYPLSDSQPSLSVKSVVHDGTYWYIFFNAMFYLRSTDGKNWTKFGCSFSVLHHTMVTAGNGKVMVVPQKGNMGSSAPNAPSNATDPGYYYLTTDGGTTWTRYLSPVYQAVFVTWGPELGFLLTSPSGLDMRFSLDGVNWGTSKNSRTGPNGNIGTLTGVRYFNGYYVFANTGQSMCYTKDGVTWGTRFPSIGSNGGSLNMTTTFVDVDGVINTEAAVLTGNTLLTTYTKTNPKVIRAPNITAQGVGNGYSLVVG